MSPEQVLMFFKKGKHTVKKGIEAFHDVVDPSLITDATRVVGLCTDVKRNSSDQGKLGSFEVTLRLWVRAGILPPAPVDAKHQLTWGWDNSRGYGFESLHTVITVYEPLHTQVTYIPKPPEVPSAGYQWYVSRPAPEELRVPRVKLNIWNAGHRGGISESIPLSYLAAIAPIVDFVYNAKIRPVLFPPGAPIE